MIDFVAELNCFQFNIVGRETAGSPVCWQSLAPEDDDSLSSSTSSADMSSADTLGEQRHKAHRVAASNIVTSAV